MNDQDLDLPLLTDIIEPATTADAAKLAAANDRWNKPPSAPRPDPQHEALAERLAASLAQEVPLLVENALREALMNVVGARLQSEVQAMLTTLLPAAMQTISAELSTHVAHQVGGLLEQRLRDDIRAALTKEASQAANQHH